MRASHDAIIIGAGPAGTTTALRLAEAGRRVAVVEKNEFPRRKVCGEYASATNLALLGKLGLLQSWRERAGPEIRRVALFAGNACVEAPMPAGDGAFGRALGRDVLDTLLLEAAKDRGAEIFQPWRATRIDKVGTLHSVTIENGDENHALCAPVIIAAHGSWEPGSLPTQAVKDNRPSDLLGFKAHFRNASLPADLMPLLVFPGGYGGMVWADAGRLSISCCIRRDRLARVRAAMKGASASDALQAHVMASCLGVRRAIGGADRIGKWLAAGPIRPGARDCYKDDIFRVGNAAGESHSIIAEGVSMAMQSGWLLAGELILADATRPEARALAGRRYTAAWKALFATRIHAANALAQVAMRPATASILRTLVSRMPALLTVGATLSGKTRTVPGLAGFRERKTPTFTGA